MVNRLAIINWLLKTKTNVVLHYWTNQQKVCMVFDTPDDAEDFAENFEGL